MKCYKMIYDFENDDDNVIVRSDSFLDYYHYNILDGECINDWNKNTKLCYSEDEGNVFTDYLAMDKGWILVSNKFYNIMHEIIDDSVQFLNIMIEDKKTGNENSSYRVLNVTKHLNALDFDNSVYDIFEVEDEKIISVEKYALKKNLVENNNIFKLENEPIPVFVSEKFKQIVEENRLTGFYFSEVKVV